MSLKSLKLDWTEVGGGDRIDVKASVMEGDSLVKVKHFDDVIDEVEAYKSIIEWLGFPLEEVWSLSSNDG